MKIDTEFPFNDYAGYIVINPEGRKNVCLVYKKERKNRTTISYARYLMSVREKRVLLKSEQVDHIDGDKTNDVIENLQILSAKENSIKRTIEKGQTLKMVEMICPNCKNTFHKPLSSTYLQKGGHYTVCSKECSYKILTKRLSIMELKELGKNQIVKHYRK
jgi:DNA-directed RNA polymerase subunit RPC12/RpoP